MTQLLEHISQDFVKIFIAYLVNISALVFTIRYSYGKIKTNNKFVLTFYLINTIVFFVCYLFIKSNINVGISLGIFAVFTLMRYKTESIKVVEMTFVFLSIGLAFINSICIGVISIMIICFANLTIVGFTYFLSRMGNINEKSIKIVYQNIDLLHPNNRGTLYTDLSRVLHESVYKVEVLEIDFEKSRSVLTVYYY
ncbi:DUF4956 domain-containing protein [Flavobacterium sp.]|uniref:DUF4956 domain-containing protein n=1 Tax=Flavobacterium sp. TaxID=239 RepID=UPI00261C1A1B|nr:DUF4956 domain-containing protein [Flavobacterium sp.]